MSEQKIDAIIVGGGIAGMWALNVLKRCGYSTVLIETGTLGMDQTFASQGMIHGGLKYALSGQINTASEAISDMPQRWRSCLATKSSASPKTLKHAGNVDLDGCALLSNRYYMFAAGNTLGRLTTFFASKALHGRIEKLSKPNWPGGFKGFKGTVYALNDFVIDTPKLLAHLAANHANSIFRCEANRSTVTRHPDGGYILKLKDTVLHTTQLISCAGNGSAPLIDALNIPTLKVQHRPLKQVLVKPKHNTAMYAHCLTHIKGPEPRLTITTHQADGHSLWYIGGQLATAGVTRSDAAQVDFAKAELETCLPWLDWQDADFSVLTINRAEPDQQLSVKPDTAYVERIDDFIQCFPTKLTLTPDMADRLLRALSPPEHKLSLNTSHPRATIGSPPW